MRKEFFPRGTGDGTENAKQYNETTETNKKKKEQTLIYRKCELW